MNNNLLLEQLRSIFITETNKNGYLDINTEIVSNIVLELNKLGYVIRKCPVVCKYEELLTKTKWENPHG